jgi:hypothetical protein
MIYKVAPVYGKKNPLIYISICSTVGSVSVMSVKAFGIALKLTLGGNNQFTHPSTYAFAIVVVVCILTQMNYFNKALSQFSTSMYEFSILLHGINSAAEYLLTSITPSVNPLYYVTFTTATLCASFLLFGGFGTSDAVNTLSLLCGFLIIFTGVYLLNLSRGDPEGHKLINGRIEEDGVPTDGIAVLQTRRSMQARRSIEPHRLSSSSFSLGRNDDRQGLMHSYDAEQGAFGLTDLVEEPDGNVDLESGKGKKDGRASRAILAQLNSSVGSRQNSSSSLDAMGSPNGTGGHHRQSSTGSPRHGRNPSLTGLNSHSKLPGR